MRNMIPTSLAQTASVVALSCASLPRRRGLVLSTMLSAALVIGVLLTFLSMAQGFALTLRNADSADIALIVRAGASHEGNSSLRPEDLRQVEKLPGIRQISAEAFVIVPGVSRNGSLKSNITFRGLTDAGIELRREVRLIEGRMFRPGTDEVIVGRNLARKFVGFEPGGTVRFGATQWKIVGVFASGGNVFESELWGDRGVVQRGFHRGDTVQVVRARLQTPAALSTLQAALRANPGLDLEADTELAFYSRQTAAVRSLILAVGWPLSIMMALGALVGAINTMTGSIAVRARELAALRAMGFRRIAVFAGTLFESIALALVAGLLGLAVVYLLFDGAAASTLGTTLTQVVFFFTLSGAVAGQALGCALCIGLLGGIFPARRAARAPIVAGLRSC